MNIQINRENLITMLGLEALPPERQLKLIQAATELVEQRLMIRVIESFTPSQRQEFDNLVDNGTDEQVAEFIQNNVPQMNQLIDEEVAQVKEQLVQNAPTLDEMS